MKTLYTHARCRWVSVLSFSFFLSISMTEGSTNTDEDTVIVDGEAVIINRSTKQLFFPIFPQPFLHHPSLVQFVTHQGNTRCATQDGSQGICTPFKECYPLLTLRNSGASGYFVPNTQLQYDILETTSPCFPPPSIHVHHQLGQGHGVILPFLHPGSPAAQFLNSRRIRRNNERSSESIICCVTRKSKPAPTVAVPNEGSKQPVNKNNSSVGSQGSKVWPPITSSCLRPNVVAPGAEANAPANAYPWMAALIRGDNHYFCGAALIDNFHVLTAAHCIDHFSTRNQVLKIKIILGAHNISASDEKGRLKINAEKIIKHSHYSSTTYLHDIALVRLAEPVNFTSTIQPLCLLKSAVEDIVNASLKSDSATLAGWGKTNDKDPAYSPTLRHATIKIYTNKECQRFYDAHDHPEVVPKVQPSMICAGSPGLESCHGDSGGPLFVTNNPDAGFGQIGIVSWGAGCGKFPGVYTRISSYIDWIQKNTVKL